MKMGWQATNGWRGLKQAPLICLSPYYPTPCVFELPNTTYAETRNNQCWPSIYHVYVYETYNSANLILLGYRKGARAQSRSLVIFIAVICAKYKPLALYTLIMKVGFGSRDTPKSFVRRRKLKWGAHRPGISRCKSTPGSPPKIVNVLWPGHARRLGSPVLAPRVRNVRVRSWKPMGLLETQTNAGRVTDRDRIIRHICTRFFFFSFFLKAALWVWCKQE